MPVGNGPVAQSAAARPAAGRPPWSQCGAADSDESVTFEQILAGCCGDTVAIAAAADLQADLQPKEPASEPPLTGIPQNLRADVSFDITIGLPSTHYGGREPLVDSVFFSDSDGDWDQGRPRLNKQAAGAGQ